MPNVKVNQLWLRVGGRDTSQLFGRYSVPEEQSGIARHFNAGTGWKNIESRRDG
jgi:hypothetical protein